jgi:hypothetical protein
MESQHLSNIKGVKAKNGNVILEVYESGKKKDGKKEKGRPITSKILSIEEAIERAEVLVVLASKMEKVKDTKVMMDVVKDILARVEEAKEQRLKKNEDPDKREL